MSQKIPHITSTVLPIIWPPTTLKRTHFSQLSISKLLRTWIKVISLNMELSKQHGGSGSGWLFLNGYLHIAIYKPSFLRFKPRWLRTHYFQNSKQREMKSTPGNQHRSFDRLLRSAELARNIERRWSSQVDGSRFTNKEKIKSRSTRKKLPKHASRKKYREPSCQSWRQIASKLNLFYQTPDIPVFESNQSSINLVNLQI